MAGRHRAPRAPRSIKNLKGPAAAGATIAAVGVAAALSSGFAGGEDPGQARLASLAADAVDGFDAASAGSADDAESTADAKPAAEEYQGKHRKPEPVDDRSAANTAESGRTQATAVMKAPKKDPVQECSTVLDGTLAPVAQVGNHVKAKYDVESVGGRAGRSGASDHPSGLALDFMVDPGTGDQVADYVLQHQDEFGITYVIWQQQYNDGSGWSPMEDRGSPTANHMDHVHVSFSGEAVDVDC